MHQRRPTTNAAARWIAANAAGWATGFPIFLLFTEVIVGHATSAAAIIGHVIGLAVFGATVAVCQTVALPGSVDRGRWILAAAIGFASVNLVIGPLYWFRIWPADGPVEPMTITLLAAVFAALAQAMGAGDAFNRSRFITLSIGGGALGVAAGAGVMMVLMDILRTGLSWGTSVAVFGLVVGAISGALTLRAFPSAGMPAAAPS